MCKYKRTYDPRQSKPFYVYGGLLQKEHRKNMGERCALWVYLWCLERCTKNGSENGAVLGGKEICAEYISEEIDMEPPMILQHLKTLIDCGYLTRIRTQHGFRLFVTKPKKWGFFRVGEKSNSENASGLEKSPSLKASGLEKSPSLGCSGLEKSPTLVATTTMQDKPIHSPINKIKEIDSKRDRYIYDEFSSFCLFYEQQMKAVRAIKQTRGRKEKFAARRKLFSLDEMKTAVVNVSQSPFHMGENDRHVKYNSIDLIMRSDEQLEKYLNMVPVQVQTEADRMAELERKYAGVGK